jgi:hypothetical protein
MNLDDDDPSVLGAGDGPSPVPTMAEGERVWKAAYVAQMIFRGIHVDDAQACCNAGSVDLSCDPAEAADDELEYWSNDE